MFYLARKSNRHYVYRSVKICRIQRQTIFKYIHQKKCLQQNFFFGNWNIIGLRSDKSQQILQQITYCTPPKDDVNQGRLYLSQNGSWLVHYIIHTISSFVLASKSNSTLMSHPLTPVHCLWRSSNIDCDKQNLSYYCNVCAGCYWV